jgi:predicted Zn-dependent protease
VALAKRAATFAVGGGDTEIKLESTWLGNVRYARNQITTSGDARDNRVRVGRDIQGASQEVDSNLIDDVGLEASVRRAERMLRRKERTGGTQFQEHYVLPPDSVSNLKQLTRYNGRQDYLAAMRSLVQTEEPYESPKLFFDSTYGLDGEHRASVVEPLLMAAKKAGLVAAGYLEVSATGRAVMNTAGRALYYPYTQAQFSTTVRDPDGKGSGWAGVDWNDWTRVDIETLSAVAIDKCLRSRNPVAIEPGRYTVVLEPQAVCDLVSILMNFIDRFYNESSPSAPFHLSKDQSKIGMQVMDNRITISADPMDPDLGFPPFSPEGNVYHPVTWVDKGILTELAYFRPYAIRVLGKNAGLPNSYAFRMSGGTATIEDMIASTERGLVVTRFSNLGLGDASMGSITCSGFTRDGLWLIEKGKLSKPVKNFRFTDSPLFMLNRVEQLGVPKRVFHPDAPVVVPPLKVRDFNFTSLSEAI